MFTPYWALLLGVPLSFALRLAQHLGVLSTVALAGGYRQVAGGRWYWSHESGATQAEINIHLSMMSALSIYTVLMRTNSPKQPGCLQLLQLIEKLNSISQARLNFQRRPILCTTLYRNLMQSCNFGGTFDQLFFCMFLWNFYRRCPSTSSILWCKKSKMTKNSNQGAVGVMKKKKQGEATAHRCILRCLTQLAF